MTTRGLILCRGLTLALCLALASPLLATPPAPVPGDSPQTCSPLPAAAPVVDTDAASPAPEAAVPAAPIPGGGGTLIARDPQTGALVPPTAEQQRELLADEYGAAALAGHPLYEEAIPGGGYTIALDGLLMDYSVASRGPDGQLRLDCLPEAAAVARFLAAHGAPEAACPTAPAPQPEEK